MSEREGERGREKSGLLYSTLKSDAPIATKECAIVTRVLSSIRQPQRREGESWSSFI